jgi:serine/threonine protein kinase
MIKIKNIKIGKILGKGGNGEVYNATYNNKEYALKVIWIKDNEIEYNTEYSHWREIESLKTLSKLYPSFFKKVYDVDIIKEGEKTFIRMLMTKMDTTFDKIILKLTDKEKYDCYIQIIYCIYLMSSNGYFHRDLGDTNIGVNYTDTKYLTIFGKKINTNGIHIMIHDFGEAFNKKFSETLSNNKSAPNDLLDKIYSSYNYSSFIKYYKIKTDIYNHFLETKCKILPEENLIIDKYLNKNIISKSNISFHKKIIYQLLFTEKFEKAVLSEKKIKFEKFIDMNSYIPKPIILLIYKNLENPKLIVEKMIELRT